MSINKAIRLDSMDVISYHNKVTILMGFEKRISIPAYARQKSESQFNRACLLLYCGREAEGNQALKNLKAEGYSHPEDEFSGLLLVDRQAYLKKLGIKVSAITPL